MTATITASATLTEAPPRRDGRGPLDTIRSEWTKLRTVRTTWYCLLVVLAGSIAVGSLVSAAFVSNWANMSAIERATFDPTFRSLSGLFLAQLAVGVLGVLAITAEYSSGMIRSSTSSRAGTSAFAAPRNPVNSG